MTEPTEGNEIKLLLEQINGYLLSDFRKPLSINNQSNLGDLSAAVNLLGEKLKKAHGDQQELISRQDSLIEILMRYMTLDFSKKAPISKHEDELDAISAGINVLVEELVSHSRKVKETEDFFRVMVENIREYAIFMIDANGFITSWNKGAEKIKGYKTSEILGKHISVFYTDAEAKKNVAKINLAKAAELGQLNLQNWRVKKDGSIFWCDISFTALYGSDNKLKGFCKVTRDITEKKLTDTRLEEQRLQLETIISNAPDAIVLINSSSQILKWNPTAEKIFGWTADETVGKFLYDFIIPQRFREKHKEGMSRFLKTGGGTVVNKFIEIEAVKKNGEEINISLGVSEPVKVKDDFLFIGFLTDITERKKQEKELAKKSEELKRSNLELEQFAYVASHDLQEPLRMVTSYVQLLEHRYKDKLDKDANDFIHYAVDGTARMRNLIQSLLEYSRVNREFSGNQINTEKLVGGIVKGLQGIIRDTNAQIIINKLPQSYGDAVMIGQVFQNLIINALKFHSDKAPEVIISGKIISGGVQFEITDNGIGIKEDYLDKIFVLFQRLHTKDKYPGTGIGLSVCKKIIERHGGKIYASSQPGKGSTFFFTIPNPDFH
jgi:PAS domain S-box-containing protein